MYIQAELLTDVTLLGEAAPLKCANLVSCFLIKPSPISKYSWSLRSNSTNIIRICRILLEVNVQRYHETQVVISESDENILYVDTVTASVLLTL